MIFINPPSGLSCQELIEGDLSAMTHLGHLSNNRNANRTSHLEAEGKFKT